MLKEIPDLSEKNVTAEGIVVFILSNIGSKSEMPLPYLRTEGAKDLRILFAGDKTFENATLRPYDGKKVRVIGDKNRGGLLIVREIELLEEVKACEAQEKSPETPPAAPSESQPKTVSAPGPSAPEFATDSGPGAAAPASATSKRKDETNGPGSQPI